MAAMAAIMDIGTDNFSNSVPPYHSNASPKFRLNSTYHSRADVWRFSTLPPWRHLRYRNRTILATPNLYVAWVPPVTFRLNPHYGLGGAVIWRFSRWPPWQPWISERNDFSNPESLCSPMPQIKFRLNPTYGLGAVVWNFQNGRLATILDIGMEGF